MKRPHIAMESSALEPVTTMDPFDLFGDEESAILAKPNMESLQPRASTHEHFLACRHLWPMGASTHELSLVEKLFQVYAGERVEACAKELKRSRSQYGRACATSLLSIATACRENGCSSCRARECAQACKDLCTTAIEESNWDVPGWQEANLLALAVLLCVKLHADRQEAHDVRAELVGGLAVALFNLAVSIASPSSLEPQWIDLVSALLQFAESVVGAAWPACPDKHSSSSRDIWVVPTYLPPLITPAIDLTRQVRTISVEDLSRTSFFEDYLQKGSPVVITGHLKADKWEALEYFTDLRELHRDAGSRLVPVSIGSPLVGHGGVVHWPLRKLIEERLLPSNATHCKPPPNGQPLDVEANCNVAYMSQHHLLHQHPPFQTLLAVPPFTLGRELSPTNVWIGTRGTVTSLHSDPSDNLLCQVSGFKYFRLYGLDQTPKLYATMLRAANTNSFGSSPVRVEMPLPAEYVEASDAIFVEGILKPGDMLFIPKSVWHYVRSLTTSVSVNFWF